MKHKQSLHALMVSVEEYNDVLLMASNEGLLDNFKNFIPTVVNDFVNFIKSIGNLNDKLSTRSGAFDHTAENAAKALANYNYMDAALLKAYCPEGFKSTYYDYALTLEKAAAYLKETPKMLDEYKNYLSLVLSTSDKIISTSEALPQFKAYAKNRDTVQKDIARHFKTGNNTSGTFGDYAKRVADYHDTIKIMNNVNDMLNGIDRAKLMDDLNFSSKILVEIRNRIKEGGYQDVSSQASKDLANITLQMAMIIELFAVTYYNVQAMNTALIDTGEVIVQAVKKHSK